MQGLLEFLRKHLYWLVFLLLEAISLVSLVRCNRYQHSVWFTTANVVSGTFMTWISNGWEYVHLGDENQYLETVNENLRREVIQLRRELRHCAVMDTISTNSPSLFSSDSVSYRIIHAQVIGSTLHRANNLITLNRGEADGIRSEMGVVSSQGVVGIVYMTSPHYSIVIPLINTQSQVSCRIRGSSFFGTMQWKHGDVLHSYAINIPRHAKLHKGQKIETNGYSDIFPEGILIGRLEGAADSPDGMYYRLKVKLAVDFSTLRNVSIIADYTKPERIQLEEHADSVLIGETSEN